jgi:hypothetical protein
VRTPVRLALAKETLFGILIADRCFISRLCQALSSGPARS